MTSESWNTLFASIVSLFITTAAATLAFAITSAATYTILTLWNVMTGMQVEQAHAVATGAGLVAASYFLWFIREKPSDIVLGDQ
jgi:hypothetical protein